MDKYSTFSVGEKYTPNYEVFITKNNKKISPFHSIPLFQSDSEKVVTVVNEIPRFENAKFEITKDVSLNPIKQDIKKGKVRFVKNLFPFKGYMWNYGAMPQTWEDKDMTCGYTHCKGDNDPLDVLDISTLRKEIGEVYQGKVLGCLAMIDDGECDWKVVVIDVRDPLSSQINTESDIEKFYPNYISSTIHWLRNYKVPDGKPENEFGLQGCLKDSDFAMEIVKEAHESWKRLFSKKHVPEICYEETGEEVTNTKEKSDLPEYINEYFFIKK